MRETDRKSIPKRSLNRQHWLFNFKPILSIQRDL